MTDNSGNTACKAGQHGPIWQQERSELLFLRKLARIAESTFEAAGEPPQAGGLLRDALRCAQDDFTIIGDACQQGSVHGMVFVRAERRLDLALALEAYRAEFASTQEGDAHG